MTEKHAYDFELKLDDPVSTHALQYRMVPDGSRVLDVGCHSGILGEALRRKKHCTVIGIDNDLAALHSAKTRLDATVQLDLEEQGWSQKVMESGNNEFDLVLFGDVIEHTREPLDILKEARGLLAPNGKIIASLPNIANLRVRLGLLFGKFDYADSGILDRTHLRFFTLRSARQLLDSAGFEIERVTYSGYSLPRWLINLFPSLFAVNIIMVARPIMAKPS